MSDVSNVWDALRKRFESQEYAVFEEVRSETGFGRGPIRTADMIAMGLWPSRGLDIHGIEIKVDRGDWLKEKRDPEKAERIARYVDHWWLAVSDKDLVRDGELPAGWGLMALMKGRMHTVKVAPKRKAAPLDRRFIASLLRAAQRHRDRSVKKLQEELLRQTGAQKLIDEAYQRGCEDTDKRLSYEQRARIAEVERLREVLEQHERATKTFYEKSGIAFTDWEAGRIGEAVRVVLGGGAGPLEQSLRSLETTAIQIHQGIAAALKGLDGIPKPG